MPDSRPKLDGEYIEVRALVDTGASGCCVSRKVIDAANLVSVDEAAEYTPGAGQRTVKLYGLAVEIPELGLNVFQLATESAPQERFDIIIGRKLLRRCVFTYNGPLNSFTLAFDPAVTA
jgi:predicted aspartyl protease